MVCLELIASIKQDYCIKSWLFIYIYKAKLQVVIEWQQREHRGLHRGALSNGIFLTSAHLKRDLGPAMKVTENSEQIVRKYNQESSLYKLPGLPLASHQLLDTPGWYNNKRREGTRYTTLSFLNKGHNFFLTTRLS